MTALDYEQVALVRVMRDRFGGSYSVIVEAGQLPEAASGFVTIEAAFTVAADIVRTELRARPTLELPAFVLPDGGER